MCALSAGHVRVAGDGYNGSEMGVYAKTILRNKRYTHEKASGHMESWTEVCQRVVGNVIKPYLPQLVDKAVYYMQSRKFIPGGRYLYASGRRYHQINSCFLLRAEDSKEGWGKFLNDAAVSLMTGGGIGGVYSDIRGENVVIEGMGGTCTGPCALMKMKNECGRYIMQGGSRRAALWAGLHWWHPDIFTFIHMKDWNEDIKKMKEKDFSFPAPMDHTNISVILDSQFFEAYHDPQHIRHSIAQKVYWDVVNQMMTAGEPGFSIDCGENEGENNRNACCEITSSDNLDMCNLGAINMSKVSNLEEFIDIVEIGTAFLLCGTLYSKLPVPEMYKVREKNRRLGLGMMGIHEWLLQRGYTYGVNSELLSWMDAYTMSGAFANRWSDKLSISRPVATRSIAPTGTISIIGETTSGIEPIPAVAYKRRYLDGQVWKAQYVVDPCAERLIKQGINPESIEDTYTLAEDVSRRIELQATLQKYVDHGISSTINIPEWGSSLNNELRVDSFGKMLIGYLPELRGMTVYPNGSRAGQPFTRSTYQDAIKYGIGLEFNDGSNIATQEMVNQVAHAINSSCKTGGCGD